MTVGYRLRVGRALREPRLLAVGEGEPKRLGARQRAAVDLLGRRRRLDERTLRKATGLSAGGLARMIERGVLVVAGEGRGARTASAAHAGEPVPRLSAAQEEAVATIMAHSGSGREILLHGVTGSGKTEVYLRSAEAMLRAGRGVLILVPEIGLTGQTVARVGDRFPDEACAVLHSGLSAGERLSAYQEIAGGRARLVIGARSAVFAPLRHLGLIVIDEEHDASYKQDNDPRYDARTVARWRAAATGAVVVLGSATPSVEAFARVSAHVDLPQRVDGSTPPPLEMVDMRDVHTPLSPVLAGALTGVVEAGDKALLFINRRGYASYLACSHCGRSWTCPHCDLSLAYFSRGDRLRCRLCGYAVPAPGSCDECGNIGLERYGSGTEAVVAEVAQQLPGVEILRLDSDVAVSARRLRDVLDRFAAPGPRVLVGTQMIAKGHHFPDVTLVGVVDADLTLRFPDFRAEERTFALLVQVGGRSGRGPRRGRVLVQTLDPGARPLALAAAGEHERFYAGELARRSALGYPPATTLVAIELSSPALDSAARAATYAADKLRPALGDAELLGPGTLSKERGRYHARLVIKCAELGMTLPVVRGFAERYASRFASRKVRLIVDVEPQRL